MADEKDVDAAAPSNGERIKRVASTVKPTANGSNSPASDKPRPTAPSPIEEPGKAAAAVRSTSSEVHKTLARDDAERMSSARVLGAELHAILRQAIGTIMALQNLEVSNEEIDKVLNERAFAGWRVVDGKGGKVIRARYLARVKAIAYGVGGGVTNAYEKLAAIQVAWPWLYGIASTIAHSMAILKGSIAAAHPIKVTPQPSVDNGPPNMVDARPIAEDGRE